MHGLMLLLLLLLLLMMMSLLLMLQCVLYRILQVSDARESLLKCRTYWIAHDPRYPVPEEGVFTSADLNLQYASNTRRRMAAYEHAR